MAEHERSPGSVSRPEFDSRRALRGLGCSRAGYTAVSSRSARSQFASSSELPSLRWM
jgi:hypothetical protein